jgi:2-iminobutanoate/2-iminopropanoate deaminase
MAGIVANAPQPATHLATCSDATASLMQGPLQRTQAHVENAASRNGAIAIKRNRSSSATARAPCYQRCMANQQVITTKAAPAAIGPYSQAIAVPMGSQKMIFCSGQIPLDPVTGELVTGDIAAQTRRVMENLAAVLAAAGASFGDVVKTTIFLADMNDFAAVNAVYAERFSANPPARATVQAARLPRDVRIEIDCIAMVGA